jgi:O-antigen ligase
MTFALVLAYVATLPLVQPVIATLGFKRIVLADVVFPALLLAAAAGRDAWLRRPRWGLCAVAAAPALAIALSGRLAAVEPWPDVARVLYSMAVLLLFAHLRLSQRQIEAIARAWVITACAVCAAGIVAFVAVTVFGAPENVLASSSSPNLGRGVVRIHSTLGANALALFLQPSATLCLYLMRRRPQGRWARRALASLAATGLLTFSRGIVGLVLVLALGLRRRLLVAATAALLAAATAATWWAVFPLQAGRLNTRPNAYRVLHVAAARMFAARPLTGVGPGQYGRRLGEFSTAGERGAAWPPVLPSADYDPHSTWLGWAAETGLLGLAAWGALYVFIARRLLAGAPGGLPRLAACALAGLALSGLTVEISHLKFVWCFLGLALAARAAEKDGVLG